MTIKWLSFAILSVVQLLIVADTEGGGKIVGGQVIQIESVPYLVSIHRKGSHHCGASLISNLWILTAAHCAIGSQANDFKIRVGSSRRSFGGVMIDVERIVMHKNYSDTTLDSDFALLKLKSSVKFNDRRQPAMLPNIGDVTPDGAKVLTAGWGLTNNEMESNEFLRGVVVLVMNQQKCSTAYSGYITDNMICAGSENGNMDSCQVLQNCFS